MWRKLLQLFQSQNSSNLNQARLGGSMFCGKCGGQLSEGTRFCGKCGASQDSLNSSKFKLPSLKELTFKQLLLYSFLVFIGGMMLIGIIAGIVSPNNSSSSKTSKSSSANTHQQRPQRIGAKIQIIVTESKYKYGYFTVDGTIQNIGDESAFNPMIKLEVFDASGQTMLADSDGWAAGTELANFNPGQSAGFELIAGPVPGKPDSVSYKVYIPEYSYTVTYEDQ